MRSRKKEKRALIKTRAISNSTSKERRKRRGAATSSLVFARKVAILAQVASAAWAKVRARVRSAGDGVRTGLGQPATFSRGGAPLRPQIR